MIQIPKILQKKEYRFITINQKKEPIQVKWNTINNYRYDDPFLTTQLKQNINYGILSKYGDLCILDFDDKQTYYDLEPKLPKTLLVGTNRGFHVYLKVMDFPSQKIKNEEGKPVLEIFGISSKGTAQFVVAPNSIHETGKKYEILQDLEPYNMPPLELTRTLQTLVSSFSFPVCSFSNRYTTQNTDNTGFQPSYCNKNNRFNLKICYNKKIRVKVFAIVPNLSLQYKDRRIIFFWYENKIYWRDLNKANEHFLRSKYGDNPYHWTGKEMSLESIKNSHGQKNSLTLVIR